MKDPKAALGEWYSGKLQKGFRELLIGGFYWLCWTAPYPCDHSPGNPFRHLPTLRGFGLFRGL